MSNKKFTEKKTCVLQKSLNKHHELLQLLIHIQQFNEKSKIKCQIRRSLFKKKEQIGKNKEKKKSSI